MNESTLRSLLEEVARGSLPPDSALERLRTLPFTEAADVLADTHRAIRQGFPEAVFAQGKTDTQTITALGALVKAHGHALATRVSESMSGALKVCFPEGRYDAVSRLFSIGCINDEGTSGSVTVICAGTSDLPVAEEAAQTLEFAGLDVLRLRDVGVAGLHRLLSKLDILRSSRVIIAVAGMEGALPGVVAGLVSAPVIAVPTSIGYGAGGQGYAALLSMLSSCSSGMGVVNIDNGFGAAMLALRMVRQSASFPG